MTARAHFAERGFLGPVQVLEQPAARRFLADARSAAARPLDWRKGWAASSRPFFALASHPAILSRVRDLLGDDVLLWGATLVQRRPKQVHAWHTDIETAASRGKAVSVWLALENCSRDSSLEVIGGSHRFGRTVQEMRVRDAAVHSDAGPADALRWARTWDDNSRVEVVATRDGEALFFDGRLWHGSENRTAHRRTAVLLQYATPDTPIRIPAHYEWPPEEREHPRPPCVLVSGEDRHHVNRIVPAPGVGGRPRLASRAFAVPTPLSPGAGPWKPYPMFHGTTAGQRSLACHVSSLVPGHSPHPPHRHDDEELLMVLAGEADVILPDLPEGERRQRLRAGDFVYYPAHFPHTIEGAGTEPVNYLMLKWIGDRAEGGAVPLRFKRFSTRSADTRSTDDGFRAQRLFEGPTQWLSKLHCHTSEMARGAGYEPHADGYDVVVIVLEGQLDSIGERLAPHGVYFYAAGEPHGARNDGVQTARYVVFEFHAQPSMHTERPPRFAALRKLVDPRRWRRRVKRWTRRVRGR